MWSRRDNIDYSLDRRSTLLALFRGSSSAMDACDADPYLKRAAKHHGEITTRPCPVCKKLEIRELRYAFGDQLGQYSGRIKSLPELDGLHRRSLFRVRMESPYLFIPVGRRANSKSTAQGAHP